MGQRVNLFSMLKFKNVGKVKTNLKKVLVK